MTTITTPPHDTELEKQVLGYCFYDLPSALAVVSRCAMDDFYHSQHKTLYSVIKAMLADDITPDTESIVRKVQRMDTTLTVAYVTQLLSEYGFTSSGLDTAINDLKGISMLREAKKVAESVLYGLRSGESAKDIISQMERGVMSMVMDYAKDRMVHISQPTEYVSDNYSLFSETTYTTGIADVDKDIMFHNGLVYILAGMPASGKSSFALQLMAHIQKQATVTFFSLEMTKEMVNYRMGRSLGKYSGYAGYQDGSAKMKDMNIYIDDTSSMSAIELRSKVLLAIHKHNTKVFFLDYVQLMDADGINRTEKMIEVSKTITSVAKETNTMWIVLSQLNKEGMAGEPSMVHLKDTSQLAQDARGIYFLIPDKTEPNVTTIKCDKQTFGKANWRHKLYFDKESSRFSMYTKEQTITGGW